MVSDVQLWNEVAATLSTNPSQDIREQLSLIVGRRNQIAHEADVDPSYGGRLWPIDLLLADDAVTFIESIAETIYVVVS